MMVNAMSPPTAPLVPTPMIAQLARLVPPTAAKTHVCTLMTVNATNPRYAMRVQIQPIATHSV